MKRPPYPYQFPQVSDAHLRAIGHLVLQWTRLDSTINVSIGYAAWRLKIARPAAESTSPFGQRINTWRDYGLQLFPKGRKEIERLVGRASNAHDRRNAIIHGHLAVPFPDPIDRTALVSVRRYIARPGFPKLRGLTAAQIEEYVSQVGWLDRDFQQTQGELGGLPSFEIQ